MNKSNLNLLLFVIFMALTNLTHGSSDDCGTMWDGFDLSHSNSTLADKTNRWRELEGTCKPAGYYYYQLSRLYAANENLALAKEYTDKGLALNDKARRYVEYMDLNLKFITISSGSNFTNAELSKLESDADSFIKKYPKWGMAYTFMASVKLAKEEYESAIDFAEKSVILEGGLAPLAGRTLGVAYTMLRQYRKALQVGNEASAGDNALFADKYFMLAMVRSYIGLEKYDTGAKVLKLLIRSKPALSDDKDIQIFANFLINKFKEREENSKSSTTLSRK